MWLAITLVALIAMIAFLAFCWWFLSQPESRQNAILPPRSATIALIVIVVALQGLSILVRL